MARDGEPILSYDRERRPCREAAGGTFIQEGRMTSWLKALGCAVLLLAASAAATTPAAAQATASPTTRDGHKDFDFLYGTWHTHYMRLRHALVGSHDWYGCDGTSVVKPFWDGWGNLEDGDLHCPHQYIRGMTLRMYSDTTHQWSLYWGTKKQGMSMPPQLGHFAASGVGDFYSNDTYDGKPVIVRYRWTLRPGDHPRFEQAFSPDNGRTWETNWTTDYTRAR
jgi:hypothetical protein